MTKQAPRRPRRWERALLVVVFTAALVAVVGLSGSDKGHQASPPAPASGAITPAATRFVQEPYMGVSCRIPSSIACDRVGLAVWLARPATVTATIAGAPLRLNDPTWSYVAHQHGRPLYVYAGFLQPAGLMARLHVAPTGETTWSGANAPAPLVRFRIDYGHGDTVITQQRVWLHPGWG